MDGVRPFSPPLEMEPISSHDGDGEWYEELGQEEEDSGGEDSVSHKTLWYYCSKYFT